LGNPWLFSTKSIELEVYSFTGRHSVFGAICFFYTGINLVPSAFGAMIIGSSPLFIAIVAHYSFHNDKMTLLKTGSIVIGLLGIAIITLGRTRVEFRGNLELLGVGLLLVNNSCPAIPMFWFRNTKPAGRRWF
jgi:drug/metabolite transporter (DMT)-like permease